MAGNIPNVSRDNFNYENLLVGGLSTIYDGVPLQQGVPVVDSDINELQDYQRMGRILDNIALTGVSFTRYGLTENDTGGFLIKQSTTTSNNFAIGAGFASIAGMVVPSTTDSPPGDFEYKDQILYSGTLTAVATNDLEDTDKLWTDADGLIASASTPIHGACIVVIVSAATVGENGHAAYITSKTATTVTIDAVNAVPGYTIIVPANLAAGDTYKILVPQLTTPSGGRTDEVYLQLWFDDINENEDTNIVNTSVAVEAVHKTAKRWAVRVSEGDVSPTTSMSDAYGFGVRYATFGTLGRLAYNDAILTAQITNSYSCFTGLSSMNPKNVHFDDTQMVAAGYPNLPAAEENVQDAIDSLLQTLAATTSGKGSSLTGSASLAGTPSSLSAGTLLSQISALLGFVNARVESVNPNASVTVPIPLFRSHGLSLTATTTVTGNVTTVYLVPASPGSTDDGLAICSGCYLDGTYAKTGATHGTSSASIIFINGAKTLIADYNLPGNSASWVYADYGAWTSVTEVGPSAGFYTNAPDFYLDCTVTLDGVMTLGASGTINRPISSATTAVPLATAINPTASIGYPNMYAVSGRSSTTADTGGWWFSQNCVYTGGATNTWAQTNTSKPSSALNVSSEGLVFYQKQLGSTTWSLTGWDSKFVVGGQADDKSGGAGAFFYPSQSVTNVFERVHYATTYVCEVEAAESHEILIPINYRSRRSTTPTASININVGGEYYITTKVFTEVDEWGGYLTITLDGTVTLTAGLAVPLFGYIDFY